MRLKRAQGVMTSVFKSSFSVGKNGGVKMFEFCQINKEGFGT